MSHSTDAGKLLVSKRLSDSTTIKLPLGDVEVIRSINASMSAVLSTNKS